MRCLMLLILMFAFTSISVAQVDYNDRIQPIFDAHCTSCHGANARSGVNLLDYDAVMSSVGENYDTLIVIPEKPDESPLVDVIENEEPEYGSRMPPGTPLDSAQIADIRAWIEEGAEENVSTSSPRKDLIANGFELRSNYPNPFNPVTQIRFTMPSRADYSVDIFSVSGQHITQITGSSSAGSVTVPVDLSGQPSGVYVYRVTIRTPEGDSARQGGRMILLK